MYIIYI